MSEYKPLTDEELADMIGWQGEEIVGALKEQARRANALAAALHEFNRVPAQDVQMKTGCKQRLDAALAAYLGETND